jgi:hypothetical protein
MITLRVRRALITSAASMLLLALAGALASGAASAATQAKPFGISRFTLQTTRQSAVPAGPEQYETGEPEAFTQAGGHPWALTTTIEFASEQIEDNGPNVVPTRDPKDAVVSLPSGLLGDPQATPRCPLSRVLNREVGGSGAQCPADTQVGVAKINLFGDQVEIGPIVNVTPEAGQSAEFALENNQSLAPLLTAHVVRDGSGYSLAVVSHDIPQLGISSVEVTFWGVPADPSHDSQRGLFCQAAGCQHHAAEPSGLPAVPFLTMPADCSAGPETATLHADDWQEPGTTGLNQQYEGYVAATSTLPRSTGCGLLSFAPTIGVQPDTLLADTPVGLGVNLQVPQAEQPAEPATPQLRDADVTLPEGLSISPGIVDGVQACNASGPEGIDFTGPESEEVGLNGELQLAAGHCPDASIVGTAEAVTPLLAEPVKGHVYLARPGCGGAGEAACTEQDALDGNLYRLYLELGGVGALAATGVNLKVEGQVEANPATGQLTTKFLNNPQLPFSELKIHLNGGPRAPLDTPAACGPAMTTADFAPWSSPGLTPEGIFMPGTADVSPSSTFEVGGCASASGLAPGFAAGTVSPQAGAFSPFTLHFTREDREQYLSGIQVHTPSGLLGVLSSVPLCEEPMAAQGSCPEASRIGSTKVASGAGSHPFEIAGNVYLTTGYKGAPFGLSIVTNAVAGPFNLGLVIVRARIDVDPVTSQLTVTSDPLPQIIFGVPLRLKSVTVDIDRPGFMFNPTNCGAKAVTAKVSGNQDAVASMSSPFAAAGCKSLEFKPSFKVSTSGKTSKAFGASLDAKVNYPPFKAGSEANIARVKVDLPKQLPSRLTTLQKACTAQVFAVNPANCPSASIVGIVKASTPLLPVGLEGPVYFVSHGGEAFPSLIVVLQGDGVRVDLTGSTFISRAGITSSTFKTVPDVPVSTFEIYLPEGKFSALAANGNLCTSKLAMPTEFVAQNGAVIHENTKIAVTGCPKAKTAKAKKSKKKRTKSTYGHGRTGK